MDRVASWCIKMDLEEYVEKMFFKEYTTYQMEEI
jgi:hypothetical protein